MKMESSNRNRRRKLSSRGSIDRSSNRPPSRRSSKKNRSSGLSASSSSSKRQKLAAASPTENVKPTLPQLTKNAVLSMVLGATTSTSALVENDKDGKSDNDNKKLIVRLRWISTSANIGMDSHEDDRFVEAVISDGKKQTQVFLLITNDNPIHPPNSNSNPNHQHDEGKDGVVGAAVQDWVVIVNGYVTAQSLPNSKYSCGNRPLMFVTSFSLLEVAPKGVGLGDTLDIHNVPQDQIAALCNQNQKTSNAAASSSSNGKKISSKTSKKIDHRTMAGMIGSFLKERAPFLTNDELAGHSSSNCYYLYNIAGSKTQATSQEKAASAISLDEEADPSDDDNKTQAAVTRHNQDVNKVNNFFCHHSAMMTLRNTTATESAAANSDTAAATGSETSSSSPSPTSSPVAPSPAQTTSMLPPTPAKPTEQAVNNYTSAIGEFYTSQLDRQKASLVSNAGREVADRASLVMKRYKATLEYALADQSMDQPLSIDLLCKWHSMLLEDLHDEAGNIRTKTVRAGKTHFAPPEKIKSQLTAMCASLEYLEKRLSLTLGNAKNTDHPMGNNSIHAITFAAIAMFGVCDIHPFVDGNGRLSRIVANWALRRVAKLPFSINLFATPSQRAEYVLAQEQTRHHISLHPVGTVSRSELLESIKCTGIFLPLVHLITDRIARAVSEFNRVCEEKSALATEAAEARAARRARERAAAGTCIICLDERPNIATLCCGKAVHLNCIAEWLGARNSCPVCRSELPSIISPTRARRREEGPIVIGPSDIAAALRPFDAEASDDDQDYTDTTTTAEDSEDTTTETTSAEEDSEDTTSSIRRRNINNNNSNRSNSSNSSEDNEDEINNDELNNLEIVRRIVEAHNSNHGVNFNDEDTTTDDAAYQEDNNNDTTTATDNEEENEDTATTSYESEEEVARNNNSETEEDTTTSTAEDGSGGSTSTIVIRNNTTISRPRANVYCASADCRNRPAADCSNSLCGRCCVLHGRYFCRRHGT